MNQSHFHTKDVFLIILVSVFSIGYSFAQNNEKKSVSLEIHFEHYVGDEVLQLDSGNYTNKLDQDFTVTKFNYYISNIQLTRKDGKIYFSDRHFLIKEEDFNSKMIELCAIPSGEYTSIQFTIGVDSLANCSGIQSGALDPIHGMFWTWNTGYIFLKLEGRSMASTAPNGILEYHIGGFKSPSNCNRTVNLPLTDPLIISKKETSKVAMHVDVLELLTSPSDIDFSVLPVVTGTENAQMICDNYVDAFAIQPFKHD